MTIAQEFVEMGKAMGLDTSECKTGNIVETLNTMTIKAGGEVTDSNLISTAMMNFRKAVAGSGSENRSGVVTETPAAKPVEEPIFSGDAE